MFKKKQEEKKSDFEIEETDEEGNIYIFHLLNISHS
jgi:hypothetical protein